jgi:hypothetical protein
MPKVFSDAGLDYFFYSNEGREPMHIHVRSGDPARPAGEAKFWLNPIREAYCDGFTAKQAKHIRKVVEDRQEEIRRAWREHFGA